MLEGLEEIEAARGSEGTRFRRAAPHRRDRRELALRAEHRLGSQPDARRAWSPNCCNRRALPIDHFSYESVELLKDIAQRWTDRRRLALAEKRLAA